MGTVHYMDVFWTVGDATAGTSPSSIVQHVPSAMTENTTVDLTHHRTAKITVAALKPVRGSPLREGPRRWRGFSIPGTPVPIMLQTFVAAMPLLWCRPLLSPPHSYAGAVGFASCRRHHAGLAGLSAGFLHSAGGGHTSARAPSFRGRRGAHRGLAAALVGGVCGGCTPSAGHPVRRPALLAAVASASRLRLRRHRGGSSACPSSRSLT